MYTFFKTLCYTAGSNSSALCECSLEFLREPGSHEDPEEVGNPVFLDSIKISSPNPKIDHCSCVSALLFQLSAQIKLKP